MTRQPHFSRGRYRKFLEDFRARRLDESGETPDGKALDKPKQPGKRREYMRDYMRWLWPYRYAAAALFLLALVGAGLEMVEPLFMRFIIDRVLLNSALDTPSRIARLNLAGAAFVSL